jgi:hypothetical protein
MADPPFNQAQARSIYACNAIQARGGTRCAARKFI